MFLRAEPIIKTTSSPIEMNEENEFGVFTMSMDISIKIIDSDFEEICNQWSVYDAILDVYERRNLNVAANMAIHIRQGNEYMLETWNGYKNQKKFAKYASEVDKYLMLV
jgi:hypothetical protein